MRRGGGTVSCLLAIDKPTGLTSHDVVGRVRRILGERRVGHAGTLDPMASGVLVVGVGQATRLLGLLTLDDKRYDARIRFGAETATDDVEGEVTRTAPVPDELCDAAHAAGLLRSLEGPCDQLPPAYSAISIDGRRAYERARSGERVELPPRRVTIHEARLTGIVRADGPSGDAAAGGAEGAPLSWDCSFLVSKGTYIRSIARDLGRLAGSAAHLTALVRRASGSVTLEDCLTLAALEELGAARCLEAALDPVCALGLASHELDDEQLADVMVGRRFALGEACGAGGTTYASAPGERLALTRRGSLMGVWERRDALVASVATFPEGIRGVR